MRITAINVTDPHETAILVTVNEEDTLNTIKKTIQDELEFKKAVDLFWEKQLVTEDIFEELKKNNQGKNDEIEFHVRFTFRNKNLRQLKRSMEKLTAIEFPYGVLEVQELNNDQVQKRIVGIAEDFLGRAAKTPREAAFYIPSRSSDNVAYDQNTKMMLLGSNRVERTFRNLSSVESVAQMAGVMRITNEILRKDIHVTKRDLFYTDVALFETQRTSDSLIEDLGAMLQVTRNSLNIVASAKGKVIGRLTFREDGDLIDCTKGVGGHSITPMIDKISDMESDAEVVLLIEKDAAFQRLAEDKFFNYIPSIVITASGQPDMATRLFVKKLRTDLDIPILGIMDADPYGLDILRVYTIGSRKMSLETSELAVSDIKWLGLLPRDLDEYNIGKKVRLKMTDADIKRADDLLQEDFVKARPDWYDQITIMKQTKEKAEIQALASRDPLFLTNNYLPTKINSGDWV
jgi:meiotic recombination protein SPO11